jgi:hypothetical protein
MSRTINLTVLSCPLFQTFIVRVFVSPTHSAPPSSMTRFLGSWFGAFPFALSEVNGRLRAKDSTGDSRLYAARPIGVPPFAKSKNECLVRDSMLAPARKKLIETVDTAVKEREESLALVTGQASSVLGGVCSNETDFTGSLKRYFREILADVVHEKSMFSGDGTLWLEESLGVTSRHRNMRSHYRETEGNVDECRAQRNGLEYDSYLSHRDYAVAQRSLVADAALVYTHTRSLNTLMDHMENLGHTSAPYVEGLAVELLPFQSQTVQWATEREQTPGGIQTFLSAKLPASACAGIDLYYNFVTGKISREKPHVVRGGIIAEQMGLGKTVISLATILRNPAPPLPESGSSVSSINVTPAISSGAAFWDPDLYSRTSTSKKKRGSIISRGTLVVVSCWIKLTAVWLACCCSLTYTATLCLCLFLVSVQRLSCWPVDRRSQVQVEGSRPGIFLSWRGTQA